MVGTTRWTLARFRWLSAASAMLMNLFDAARVLLNLALEIKSRGGRCVSFIENCKSNEISLFFIVSDTEGCHAGGSGNALAVVGPSVQATCKQKARTKVLQSHRELAALFEVDADHRCLVRTFIPMPLQVMASTKMEVYLKCFQHTFLPISELKAFFEQHIRLCTTDGDGAVAAGLRGVAHMSDDVRQVHQKCDIHKLSNKLTSMTSPLPVEMHVSSLINFSLSLQAANTMRSFREALRVVIAARLVFRHRWPRKSNIVRNMSILKMCIPGSSRTDRMRIAILSRLFSGSWDQHDIIEHDCIGPECCRDREQCLLKMHTLGVASLCATSPPTFPRSRWTGFVPALCWPLLLEMIHGLLSVTYKVWASQQRAVKMCAKRIS